MHVEEPYRSSRITVFTVSVNGVSWAANAVP